MYSDKSMKETETISIANQNQENEMEFRLCVRACQPLLLLIPSNVCQIKRNDPATSGDEMQKTNKTLIVCVEWNCCPIPTYTQSVFSQGELSHELSKKKKKTRDKWQETYEKKKHEAQNEVKEEIPIKLIINRIRSSSTLYIKPLLCHVCRGTQLTLWYKLFQLKSWKQ